MRNLPKEINHVPNILFLKFPVFFLCGTVAAIERLVIVDDTHAFIGIAATYAAFIVYDRLLPRNFFYYLLTREDRFDPPKLSK